MDDVGGGGFAALGGGEGFEFFGVEAGEGGGLGVDAPEEEVLVEEEGEFGLETAAAAEALDARLDASVDQFVNRGFLIYRGLFG